MLGLFAKKKKQKNHQNPNKSTKNEIRVCYLRIFLCQLQIRNWIEFVSANKIELKLSENFELSATKFKEFSWKKGINECLYFIH